MVQSKVAVWCGVSLLGALTIGACGGSALNEGQQESAGASTGGRAGSGGMAVASGGSIGVQPLPDPQCPVNAPAFNAACSTPPSLKCTWRYSDCAYRSGYCDAGTWRDTTPADLCWSWTAPPDPMGGSGGNVAIGGGGAAGGDTTVAPSSPTCPASAPTNGSACSVSDNGGLCVYDAAHPCNTQLATCAGGVWSIAYYAIDCSGGASGSGGAPTVEAAGASGWGGAAAVEAAGAGGADEG